MGCADSKSAGLANTITVAAATSASNSNGQQHTNRDSTSNYQSKFAFDLIFFDLLGLLKNSPTDKVVVLYGKGFDWHFPADLSHMHSEQMARSKK